MERQEKQVDRVDEGLVTIDLGERRCGGKEKIVSQI